MSAVSFTARSLRLKAYTATLQVKSLTERLLSRLLSPTEITTEETTARAEEETATVQTAHTSRAPVSRLLLKESTSVRRLLLKILRLMQANSLRKRLKQKETLRFTARLSFKTCRNRRFFNDFYTILNYRIGKLSKFVQNDLLTNQPKQCIIITVIRNEDVLRDQSVLFLFFKEHLTKVGGKGKWQRKLMM